MATLSAAEKIKSLQTEINKQIEAVKTDLAKQLNTACETLKVLRELEVKDVLSDPQYAEYVQVLGIPTIGDPKIADVFTVQNRRGMKLATRDITVAAAILKSLDDKMERNVLGINEKASEIRGETIKPSTINQTLMKLKKDRKVLNPSRGHYKIA